jgi:hypothetical protein
MADKKASKKAPEVAEKKESYVIETDKHGFEWKVGADGSRERL